MFHINIDLHGIIEATQAAPEKAAEIAKKRAGALAAQVHAHIVEKASDGLHSSKDKYISALRYSQVDEDTWIVTLDKSAFWIEDGIPPDTEMIDWLLKEKPGSKGKVKTAKDGSKYRVIPFSHGEAPSRMTQAGRDLQGTIRAELKKRDIPYKSIERNGDGSPKVGMLHGFDIMDKPLNTGNMWKHLHGHGEPGMGWGMPGQVRQGKSGIPFLQGVRIYQRLVTDENGKNVADKNGQPKARRDIMTFRVVSSNQKGTGMWVHPGLEGKKFLDEGFEWALREWDGNILPSIYKELEEAL